MSGLSSEADRERDEGMSRRRLMAWAAAGAAGIAAAGAAGSAQPAQAAEAEPTSAAVSRAVSGAASVAVPKRPIYTVHQILPGAPANAIALTIDDGPDAYWTPRVLTLLRRYDVRATFSVIGGHTHANRGLIREIVAEGHTISNHTMTHPLPFTHRTAAAIEEEISRAQSAIVDAAGTAPRLFRSPGGDWSSAVFTAAAKHGLTPIDWDVDPRDWSRPGTQKIIDNLLAAKPGDILLCHDGGGDRSQTVKALQTVLPRLKGKGYTFVNL